MSSAAVSTFSRDDTLARLAEPVASAMAQAEDQLGALVSVQTGGLVPVIYQHMLKAGGKRLRPLLVLLSCGAAGGDPSTAVNFATAVEVLHLASLIHDDVIDEASERRGRPSARQQWGNRASILVGDFLVAEVFRRMADEFGRQGLAVLARSVAEMCQAELTEQAEDPAQASEDIYFRNIRGKTGALMAAACEVGAVAAGNETACEPLSAYGLNLGQAFQIVDDLLDLYGDPEALGKPVLQDLAKGQWTLPVIHALRVAETQDAARLSSLLRAAPGDPAAAREAAQLAGELGGEIYARRYARNLLDGARSALNCLAPSQSRDSLLALSEYVVERRH